MNICSQFFLERTKATATATTFLSFFCKVSLFKDLDRQMRIDENRAQSFVDKRSPYNTWCQLDDKMLSSNKKDKDWIFLKQNCFFCWSSSAKVIYRMHQSLCCFLYQVIVHIKWTRMSFIIILVLLQARHHHVCRHDNQFCNCLTTSPVLQQHPKSKYTVIYCISAATNQPKKARWRCSP